jgi:hypothetical protein
MSILAMVIMAAAGVNSVAAGTGGEPVQRVIVCMDKAGNVELRFATERASEIFRRIGVEIDWRIGDSCPSFGEVIRISFSFVTPDTLRLGALAYAHPYEGTRIVVFYDRVCQQAKARCLRMNRLLAYVLAHEIAHLLQGISRHSATGIMKAQWTADDILPMRRSALCFSPLDVELIGLGLAARQSQIYPARD